MKKIAIIAISFYQIIISSLLKQLLGVSASCRYSPTCSEYAKEKISQKGVIVGGGLALKRILSCHPFAKVSNSKYNKHT